MRNLLKADFYKLIRTKMGYILIIVCAALSLISIGTYGFLKFVTYTFSAEDAEARLAIDALLNGRSIMFSSFSLSSNVGILIPIFVGIFTLTDIRHGTIRNKILYGENRTKIYLSHLIVSSTLSLVAIIISFLILLIGGLVLFGYGFEFNANEALNFLRCLVIGLLSFIYVASISTFFALVTKSTPLTVLLSLALTIGLSLFIQILYLIPTNSLDVLMYMIPTYSSLIVSQGGYISLEEFLYGFFSLLFFITFNTALGIYLFKKLDLK